MENLEASDWISLSAVFVAVVAAGVSVWQAFIARRAGAEQLELAKRVQREQNEPYVVVDIGPHETGSRLIVLSIHNSGPTMARDVRVQVTPELVSTHANLTDRVQRAVSRTIPFLPPGRKLVYPFDTSQRWQSDLPMQFDVTVNARGPEGEVEALTYRIDLDVLAGYLPGERPGKGIEDHLKKIETHLGVLNKTYKQANSEAIRTENQRWIDELRREGEEEASRNTFTPPDA
ncbi:hypothetical protein G5C60_37450 [Streptomyces sp. HC44]|uniref:Uncharacterized protein n=1 Tax=Streptomyces scabichelini TaxID=2711217 RepID=A0A6G4VH49_9ACTN|nr:hypothetical protein [Streptomyces scabichelini]NGO13134.1 hypothetical protein [Streptomyces scabichelini]